MVAMKNFTRILVALILTICAQNLPAQFAGSYGTDNCGINAQYAADECNTKPALSDPCQEALRRIEYGKCMLNNPKLCDKFKGPLRLDLADFEKEYQTKCGQGQRTSQNASIEEIEQRQAQRKTEIIIETQNYLSASQEARREYNEEQLQKWKKDLEKYNGASIGNESPASYYEEKYTDAKSSERVAERLLNFKLDDDEFSPGDIPAAESDNVFVRVSEEEIKRRIEQAKEETKNERKEKEEKMCLRADDHYNASIPAELRVDAWNNPLDVSAMNRFVRENGAVLYQGNGLIIRYLIHRAIHESGHYYKVCSVDTLHNRHTSDRNLGNDGRIFHWYNLYYSIENTSDTNTVMFKTYPCIEISMTGASSWDMCDEWLCSGAERFGNSAKLSITSSPHIMHPASSLVEFKGAWYPADQREEPQLSEWTMGRFDLKSFSLGK
jgi:hypothetical protein